MTFILASKVQIWRDVNPEPDAHKTYQSWDHGLAPAAKHYLWAHLPPSHQELRSREEELLRAAQEQRFQEEQLRRREQELAEREMDIVERELHLLMSQLSQEKPRVRKRKGNFKRSHLLKLREGSSHISLPSGTYRSLSSPRNFWGAGLSP